MFGEGVTRDRERTIALVSLRDDPDRLVQRGAGCLARAGRLSGSGRVP